MSNIVPFKPKKQKPAAPVAARLTEADMRWLCAATSELRRLRDLTGEESQVGQRLDQAYRALLTSAVEIADSEGW
jgi:hypothetical protein